MATLKKQVFDICKSLAQHGWADLLKSVTTVSETSTYLNINQMDEDAFEAELLKEIEVDRFFSGFEDFALEGNRGITPGQPAHSLLYHAFASPNVVWQDINERIKLSRFPSIQELEIVENYVFGIRPPSITFLKRKFLNKHWSLNQWAIVVFANQYRTAVDTPHQKHADLVFSRTGVARVGTESILYNEENRSFEALIDNDPFKLRGLPAKYNAYLALKVKGTIEILGPRRIKNGDEQNIFWLPVHKLFSGDECISSETINVLLNAIHKNEKIKRLHVFINNTFKELGIDTGHALTKLVGFPFEFEESIARIEEEMLVVPIKHKSLVEKTNTSFKKPILNDKLNDRRKGIKNNCRVFSGRVFCDSISHIASSLEIRSFGSDIGSRRSPEYLHIRTGVAEGNLNSAEDIISQITDKEYKSHHYVDFTGDGFVDVSISGLTESFQKKLAYSIVAAPDFFPYIDQSEIFDKTRSLGKIWSTEPETLADQRFSPNLNTHKELQPLDVDKDKDITALIQLTFDEGVRMTRFNENKVEKRVSYLTDAAAGVFAPGWDTSFDITVIGGMAFEHLAAYGLGSPFPEDSKLCAALSSFWPAVAPDISRSFWPENGFSPTIIPHLDSEIGAHNSNTGWDGEIGPTLIIQGNKKFLRYKRMEYVDYTLNAVDNKFNFHIFANIDAKEYITRLLKMKRVNDLDGGKFKDWLFSSYTQVNLDDPDVQRAMQLQNVALRPVIHKFIFLKQKGEEHKSLEDDFQMIDVEIDDEAIVLVDAADRVIVLD